MKLMIKIIVFIAIIFLVICFIVSLNNKNSTNLTNIGVKGSFMIAAIGKDGIIVATETRGNIFDKRDKKETPIGYYDGVQKEFVIGKTVLANTGKGVIGNAFFAAIIKDFTDKLIQYPSVDNFFNMFSEYCKKYVPKELNGQVLSNLMLVAGFQNEKPIICYYQKSEEGCIENEGYIESDTTIFKEKYSKNHTCDRLARLAEKAIKKYSNQNDNWKTIGGEVCIIKITNENGPVWVKKVDFKEWKYTDELIKDYYEGKLEINLIEPFKKENLDTLFKD